MFKIKFDGNGITESEKSYTINACKLAVEFATLSLKAPKAAIEEWFGADSPQLRHNLKRMNSVMTNPERTVTFVDARKLTFKVEYNPDDISAPPKPLTDKKDWVPVTNCNGLYAFVYPVNARAYCGRMYVKQSETLFHVGSGMRLYLAHTYLNLDKDSMERPQTIYHEMSHKVLGTNDHTYEPTNCRDLKALDRAKALKNADNYAYMVTSLKGHKW